MGKTKKKIYVAGPLCEEEGRKFLEKIERLCKELGFETFLPHRDAGLYKELNDIKKIPKRPAIITKNSFRLFPK